MFSEAPEAEVATRLRLAREALGLAQWRIADAVGVTSGFLCQLESGRKMPTPELAQRLVEVLNQFTATSLSVYDLFPGLKGGRHAGAEEAAHRR